MLQTGYLRIRDSVSGATGTRVDHKLAVALSPNVWTHVTVKYDYGTVWIYYDGNEIDHFVSHSGATLVTTSTFNKLYLGKDNKNSGYNGNCMLSDFRIYDHCLSDPEIRELARGLIVHYKMNVAMPNLIKGLRDYTSNGYQAYSFYLSTNLKTSTTYTIQLWDVDVSHSGKTAAKTGLGFYWGGGNVALKTILGESWFPNGHADHISLKITTPSSGSNNSYINIYNSPPSVSSGTMYMSIGSIKIEESVNPTTITKYDDQYIHLLDSSGNGYDAEAAYVGQSSGSISVKVYGTDSSPRYSHCAAVDPGTVFRRNSVTALATSVSFWLSLPSIPSTSGTAYQTVFTDYLSRLGMTFGRNTPQYFTCAVGSQSDMSAKYSSKAFNDKKFHHVVIIRPSQAAADMNRIVYIDGILQNPISGTDWWSCSSGVLDICGRGTSINNSTTYMSDFRMYATPLKQEDVLDLYHTSAFIYKDADLHAFEIVEYIPEELTQDVYPEITKSGNFFAFNFTESRALEQNIKILSDGSMWLRVLHHENPASNLFTAGNCWRYDNGSTLYSALYLLKDNHWKYDHGGYELLACEKLTSSSSEVQYRWIQTSNPATSSVIRGFQAISGPNSDGHFIGLLSNGQKGAIHNGDAWWCCCGSYTQRSQGLPGFGGNVTTGSLDLYIRVGPKTMKGAQTNSPFSIYEDGVLSKNIIEI